MTDRLRELVAEWHEAVQRNRDQPGMWRVTACANELESVLSAEQPPVAQPEPLIPLIQGLLADATRCREAAERNEFDERHRLNSMAECYADAATKIERFRAALSRSTRDTPPPPFVLAPISDFEYHAGRIIREAVDHDPDKMRFYLLVSVGELAQRIAWAAMPPHNKEA